MKNKLKLILSNFKATQTATIELALKKLRLLYAWPTHLCLIFILALIYFYIDRPLATFFYQHRAILSLLQIVSWFHGSIVIFLLICLTLLAKFKCNILWQRCFGFTALWFTLIYLVCGVIKVLAGRARPEVWMTQHLFGFFGPAYSSDRMFQSFPSGHTATWIAMMLGFALFFPTYLGRFIFIGLIFSLIRVVLAQHYLSDVLGTMYLIVLGFVTLLMYLGLAQPSKRGRGI